MKSVKMRVLVLVAVIALSAAFAFWRFGGSDRVTLRFRNAPLEKVVASIRRQTRATIFLQPRASGKITIDVHRIPLTEALRMVASQADCQFTPVYALYSRKAALKPLEEALGSGTPVSGSWSNYAAPPRPGVEFARNAAGSEDQPVTLQFEAKPVAEAASVLGRFAAARMVVQDGVTNLVDLRFAETPFAAALKELARQSGLKWQKSYVLKPFLLDNPPTHEFTGGADVLLPGGDHVSRLPPPGAQPVMIPFGGAPPAEAPVPEGAAAPDPETVKKDIMQHMMTDLRESTPEQRADRLRRTSRTPPPGIPKAQ